MPLPDYVLKKFEESRPKSTSDYKKLLPEFLAKGGKVQEIPQGASGGMTRSYRDLIQKGMNGAKAAKRGKS